MPSQSESPPKDPSEDSSNQSTLSCTGSDEEEPPGRGTKNDRGKKKNTHQISRNTQLKRAKALCSKLRSR